MPLRQIRGQEWSASSSAGLRSDMRAGHWRPLSYGVPESSRAPAAAWWSEEEKLLSKGEGGRLRRPGPTSLPGILPELSSSRGGLDHTRQGDFVGRRPRGTPSSPIAADQRTASKSRSGGAPSSGRTMAGQVATSAICQLHPTRARAQAVLCDRHSTAAPRRSSPAIEARDPKRSVDESYLRARAGSSTTTRPWAKGPSPIQDRKEFFEGS